jgi:hypothetical protein
MYDETADLPFLTQFHISLLFFYRCSLLHEYECAEQGCESLWAQKHRKDPRLSVFKTPRT